MFVYSSLGSSKSDRGSLEPVMEQESVSEQIQSELEHIQEESFDIPRVPAEHQQEDEDDSDVMEMSFFEDLKVRII